MTRTLGVIGTLVWDRIHARDRRAAPVEEWGGIAYALAAASAALPEGWRVLPIVKLGRDLSQEGRRFLRELPGFDDAGVVIVPEPNNRVELRYESSARRCERLTGGVPGWTWPELAPLVALCDALYVNFISGFEMSLETARSLRRGYDGPIYADLHSLFLGVDPRGLRIPRSLEAWAAWLRCFDAVQMNEDEFDLLGVTGDPWKLAAGAL
jgi:sugar/nucleoside kinase (ribokinase family)